MATGTRASLTLIAMAVALIFTAKVLIPFFAPFVLAIVLTALITPMVDRLEERFKWSRGLAVAVILSVAVLLIVTLLGVVTARLVTEIGQFITDLPTLRGTLTQRVDESITRLRTLYAGLPAPIEETTNRMLEQLSGGLSNLARNFLDIIGAVPAFLFQLVIASIATYFLSKDQRLFGRTIMQYVPRTRRSQVLQIKDEIARGIIGFLRAQVILVGISAVLAILGLSILRVPYAWFLGLLAGFLDIVPMVGPSGVFLPLAGYHMATGNVGYGIAILVVLGALLAVRQLVEPRVVGAYLGLHPLTSLVAVFAGVRLLGVEGFLLAPILLVVVKAILVIAILPQYKQR